MSGLTDYQCGQLDAISRGRVSRAATLAIIREGVFAAKKMGYEQRQNRGMCKLVCEYCEEAFHKGFNSTALYVFLATLWEDSDEWPHGAPMRPVIDEKGVHKWDNPLRLELVKFTIAKLNSFIANELS